MFWQVLFTCMSVFVLFSFLHPKGVGVKHQPTNQATKRESEPVNQRRTGNAMAKRKRTMGQTMMYKLLHIKLKIEQDEPCKNWEGTQVLSRRVYSSCFTCGTRHVTLGIFYFTHKKTPAYLFTVTNKINMCLH